LSEKYRNVNPLSKCQKLGKTNGYKSRWGAGFMRETGATFP